jgi:hypothetical protein
VLILRENRELNLSGLLFESFKLIDLIIICWTNIIMSPKPNSTADRMRKKKVSERIFKLSYIKPIDSEIIYKVIHNNSAVKSKCSAVLMFKAMLVNIRKNSKNKKFMSPKITN